MKTETLHAMFVVWTHLTAGPRVKSNTFVVQEDFLDSDSYNNVCLSVCVHSVMADSLQPHGPQPSRLLCLH